MLATLRLWLDLYQPLGLITLLPMLLKLKQEQLTLILTIAVVATAALAATAVAAALAATAVAVLVVTIVVAVVAPAEEVIQVRLLLRVAMLVEMAVVKQAQAV